MSSHGDRDVALGNEILRTVCGSGVHGMAIAGTDDHDEMGVYVERPDQLLGIAPTAEHYTSRSKPDGVRSQPGDTDLVMYSLRHWMRLATAGNPTVLTVLYAPDDAVLARTSLGDALRDFAPKIVSQRAGRKFLGYLHGQRERLTGGGKQSRVPNRPELIERYGYDVKYASHAIRLGYQGIELMQTGRLTLPMSGEALESALSVKSGHVSYVDALGIVDDVADRLAAAVNTPDASPLPAEPDHHSINMFLIGAHYTQWRWPL